ncbi:hypothetical protein TorRG33x02_108730 [Trema orientale]|uniref:F-box protein At3g26010-like beta-propeller domain-containing protein n=1 Tax=Trema orientale TaxID=63057 RepID=A0A2P5F685_TREOI|nr:hypothetical protein TorRG33x02_108730 [Trema orientale]
MGNKYVFSGVIFCSETGKWSPSTFSISWALDHGFMFPSDFVTNNGTVYSLLLNDFGHKVKGIVAFDPFIDVTSDDEDDIPKRCHFIHLPIDFCHRWKGKVCFGVVQGRLRLSQLLKFKGDFVLKIWELNDNNSGGDWLLVHHVRLTSAKTYKTRVAAFHPNNGNVIFMLHNSEREIYRYEIGEEKFEKIGRLPSPVSELSNFYICSPALLCIFRGLHCTTSENKKVERLAKYWRIRHA